MRRTLCTKCTTVCTCAGAVVRIADEELSVPLPTFCTKCTRFVWTVGVLVIFGVEEVCDGEARCAREVETGHATRSLFMDRKISQSRLGVTGKKARALKVGVFVGVPEEIGGAVLRKWLKMDSTSQSGNGIRST
jgi:hypothetical protein